MVVTDGSRVKIEFTATYPDGGLFDTSSKEVAVEHGVSDEKRIRPIVMEIGAEPTIESLEAGLLGLAEGETKRIDVPHDDLRFVYDRDVFETMLDGPAEVGAEVHTSTGLIGEIIEVDDEVVTIDIDPTRSGQVLTFEVEVVEID